MSFLKIVFSVAVVVLFTACSGVGKHSFTLNDQYINVAKPKVNIGLVTKSRSVESTVEVEQILKDAVSEELTTEGFLQTHDNHESLTLNLKVVQYSEGNAFKRWLSPTWGETSLMVRAELNDGEKIVGTATCSRSVTVGGFLTMGAWKFIFSDLAKDLVSDLKSEFKEQRINNQQALN